MPSAEAERRWEGERERRPTREEWCCLRVASGSPVTRSQTRIEALRGGRGRQRTHVSGRDEGRRREVEKDALHRARDDAQPDRVDHDAVDLCWLPLEHVHARPVHNVPHADRPVERCARAEAPTDVERADGAGVAGQDVDEERRVGLVGAVDEVRRGAVLEGERGEVSDDAQMRGDSGEKDGRWGGPRACARRAAARRGPCCRASR